MIDSTAVVYPPLQCWIQSTCLCVREVELVMLVQFRTVNTNESSVLKWSCWAEVLVFHYTFVCSI